MLKKIALVVFLFLCYPSFSQGQDIQLISWNIQDFGKTKSNEELEQMAEILRYADIVALQEVVAGYGGAQAVARLSDELNRKGAQWDYVISDPTNSPKYAAERYAFLWKTKHVKIKKRGKLISALKKEVDREPFALDFYVNGEKFTVLNFHSRPYYKNPQEEISAITRHIRSLLASPLLLVGDFNLTESDASFDDLKSYGFNPALTNERTTLKRACNGDGYINHAIDNVFYSKQILKIDSRVIDFVGSCGNLKKARELSDHLPVFMRFNIKE